MPRDWVQGVRKMVWCLWFLRLVCQWGSGFVLLLRFWRIGSFGLGLRACFIILAGLVGDYFGWVFALAGVEGDIDAEEAFTPLDCLELTVFIEFERPIIDDAVAIHCLQLQFFPLEKRLLRLVVLLSIYSEEGVDFGQILLNFDDVRQWVGIVEMEEDVF